VFDPMKPMLAPSAAAKLDEIPRSGWWLEPKYDGIRFQVHQGVAGPRAVGGRNLKEHGVPGWLEEALTLVPAGTVLDGELYVPGGHSALVGAHAHADQRRFVVFDLLKLGVVQGGSNDVRNQPLTMRRKLLERLSLAFGAGVSITPRCVNSDAWEYQYKAWLDQGLEGAMAKRMDSRYKSGGRSKDWRKLKPKITVDAVPFGYELGKGKHNGHRVGALKVFMLDGDKLTSVESSVGWDGTVEDARKLIGRRIEIECQQVMESGKPRSPVFLRTRPDLEGAVE
jgi:bifunctional non-homologous end joining protein LigD